MLKVYCDSSTKEACYLIEGQRAKIVPYDQPVTNNIGEYKAVILALEAAKPFKQGRVVVLTDSQLVVNQVSGEWKCKAKHLLPFRDKVRELLIDSGIDLQWLVREENLAGKILG